MSLAPLNGGIGFAAEVAKEINELRSKFPAFKNLMKFSGKNIYSMFLAKRTFCQKILYLKTTPLNQMNFQAL